MAVDRPALLVWRTYSFVAPRGAAYDPKRSALNDTVPSSPLDAATPITAQYPERTSSRSYVRTCAWTGPFFSKSGRVRAEAIGEHAESAFRASVNGSGKRVLVVDDNEDAANVVAELLSELGHEVRVAHDGPSALSVARVFQPRVCVLDIGLPVMDGYELARHLRAMPQMPSTVRMVALTGYGQPSDRQRTAEAGFDEHLVKPVDLKALERVVA